MMHLMRQVAESRWLIVNAVEETTRPFTVEELAKRSGVDMTLAAWWARMLDKCGYLTTLSREPAIFAKSESWTTNIYNIYAVPWAKKTWYDVWGHAPHTWVACGL